MTMRDELSVKSDSEERKRSENKKQLRGKKYEMLNGWIITEWFGHTYSSSNKVEFSGMLVVT